MSNPALIRDLDREGAELLKAIDAIPRGREHDMTGHLDAKRACCRKLAALMKRWREEGLGNRPMRA